MAVLTGIAFTAALLLTIGASAQGMSDRPAPGGGGGCVITVTKSTGGAVGLATAGECPAITVVNVQPTPTSASAPRRPVAAPAPGVPPELLLIDDAFWPVWDEIQYAQQNVRANFGSFFQGLPSGDGLGENIPTDQGLLWSQFLPGYDITLLTYTLSVGIYQGQAGLGYVAGLTKTLATGETWVRSIAMGLEPGRTSNWKLVPAIP